MTEKAKDKIQRLLALANDSNDEESMTALLMAQKLMLEYKISEKEVFEYKQKIKEERVIQKVIYKGKPQKWVYRLAMTIAENFRVKFFYKSQESTINLVFLGQITDVEIAEITFMYAKGSIAYCSKEYMRKPEIKRKYKRKWHLKQDYIEGYLSGLNNVFNQQKLTNGYELALQLPEIVIEELKKINLVKGKDTTYQVEDSEAYYSGYQEGSQFRQKELIN